MGVLVFLNGQFLPESQAVVPVSDRGFLLGDGLFETLRVVRGRPFRLPQHLERLARGAEFLKINLPFTPLELEIFAGQLIEQNKMPDAILRLTLTRGPGGRGYTPNSEGKTTVVMTLHPAPGAPSAGPACCKNVAGHAEPVPGVPLQWNLITSSFRIPAGDPLAAFKTTSKILHIMARAEAAEQGADEALLLNTNGEAAETAGGNLFWVQDNTICTVPAGRGILPGVTRAAVLEICQMLGLRTGERAIKPAALKNFAGLFVTQSVFGIVPVAALDGKLVAPSPLVDQVARAYRKMLVQQKIDFG
jgi:branched-subunit amino acid aminotransferase/4-amino-4-deoxychorismate lyase